MAKKYLTIYDQLKNDIISQIMKEGDKLPSENRLAEIHGVSRLTIRHVLQLLEEDGLIRKEQGSGSYVSYKETKSLIRQIAVLFYALDMSIFPAMIRSIDETLSQHGYTAVFYTTGNCIKERETLLHLIENPVEGIIMLSIADGFSCWNLDLMKKLRSTGTKILFFDSWYADRELSDIPLISISNYEGVQKITEYLIQQGHRRIGSLMLRAMHMQIRAAAVTNVLLQHPGLYDKNRFLFINYPDDPYLFNRPEYLRSLKEMDAFLCLSGEFAKALVVTLQREGSGLLKTIVIFDEVELPPLPGVEYIILKHASERIAVLCAEKILDMIAGEPPVSIEVPWELSPLSTAKALPAKYIGPDEIRKYHHCCS